MLCFLVDDTGKGENDQSLLLSVPLKLKLQIKYRRQWWRSQWRWRGKGRYGICVNVLRAEIVRLTMLLFTSPLLLLLIQVRVLMKHSYLVLRLLVHVAVIQQSACENELCHQRFASTRWSTVHKVSTAQHIGWPQTFNLREYTNICVHWWVGRCTNEWTCVRMSTCTLGISICTDMPVRMYECLTCQG